MVVVGAPLFTRIVDNELSHALVKGRTANPSRLLLVRPQFLIIAAAALMVFASRDLGNAASAATLEILGPAPGTGSALVAGSDGNFYGTSFDGGDFGAGTIFRMTPSGQITILKSFEESTADSRAADGSHPFAALVRGPDSRLYGSTTTGGGPSQPASPSGTGTIFAISNDGQFQKIVNVPPEWYSAHFNLIAGTVIAPLTFGQNGEIYGTTEVSIFKLSLSGDFTKLVSMPPNDIGGGRAPAPVIVASSDGKFYGTSNGPDVFSPAYAFVMTPDGTSMRLGNVVTSPTSFYLPGDPLLEATDGNFYGLGARSDIFRVTRNGTVTFLHQFQPPEGIGPDGGLVQGPDGNFYGTTVGGGANDPDGSRGEGGTVFRMTPSGDVTTLASFEPITGTSPRSGLVIGSDGCFYGTTSAKGPNGTGTIFRLTAFPPEIRAVIPYVVGSASLLVVNGRFFSGTIGVTIDGDATPFQVDSPTQITIFPQGARHGTLSVTTPLGTGSIDLDQAAASSVANLSSRLFVFPGDNALFAGFIVTGSGNKKLLLRGMGPSLTAFGIANALQDPTVELRDQQGTKIGVNDNWRQTQLGGVITAPQEAEIQGSGLAPSDDREAAIVANLAPGTYTAIERGIGNTSGVGVIELYDLDSASSTAKLANISTRGSVSSNENVLIGGFVVAQPNAARIIVRAIGPSLAGAGVANPIMDPSLDLRDANGAQIAFNDDWRGAQEQEIKQTTIPPSDDREAAIVATIAPGSYTAIVRGAANETGTGVVEIYNLVP
jgi:uncharacterized repeat protein (TIGR03803 family)